MIQSCGMTTGLHVGLLHPFPPPLLISQEAAASEVTQKTKKKINSSYTYNSVN